MNTLIWEKLLKTRRIIHTVSPVSAQKKTPNIVKTEWEDWKELQRIVNATSKTNAFSICMSNINKTPDTAQESQKKVGLLFTQLQMLLPAI